MGFFSALWLLLCSLNATEAPSQVDEDGVTWSVMKVDWLTIKTSHVSGKTNNVLIAAPNKSGKKRELVIDYGDGPHDDGRLKVTQFP